MTFGFRSPKYIWMLAALIAMQVAQPYLAYESVPAHDPKIAWQLHEWHTRRALFDYFSFATISGVGYGDMSTTSPTSNTLKWLEVMCGQFYIAIVVASIVGMKLAQAVKPGGSEGR